MNYGFIAICLLNGAALLNAAYRRTDFGYSIISLVLHMTLTLWAMHWRIG